MVGPSMKLELPAKRVSGSGSGEASTKIEKPTMKIEAPATGQETQRQKWDSGNGSGKPLMKNQHPATGQENQR